jgi:hypothetical protein
LCSFHRSYVTRLRCGVRALYKLKLTSETAGGGQDGVADW